VPCPIVEQFTTDIGRVIRFCLPAKIDDDFQTETAGLENDTRSDEWEWSDCLHCLQQSKRFEQVSASQDVITAR
jgi:hypothetical protein